MLDIGVEASIIHKWVKKILDLADAQLKPSMVSIYSPQVRFLYNSNYVAITPVVSHSFMAEVERLARKRIGRFGNIKHRHPTSLGDLSGSIGGNFYILKYPPRLTRNESASLAGSGFKRLEAGESLFDSRAIFNKGFYQRVDPLFVLVRYLLIRLESLREGTPFHQLKVTWLIGLHLFLSGKNQLHA